LGTGPHDHEADDRGVKPDQLSRNGVTKKTIPVGTELALEGYRSKDGR
jgi:hypothetical protein